MPTSLKAVTHAQNIRYDKAAEALYIIDQSLLPHEERELRLQSVEEMVEAIQALRVRGTPPPPIWGTPAPPCWRPCIKRPWTSMRTTSPSAGPSPSTA